MILLTPHGDKLEALLQNNKLPDGDRDRIRRAIKRYRKWLTSFADASTDSDGVTELVHLLNEYRLFLDLEVVFDSQHDFLYRQKGQLKLDNSVIEEFLPHLVSRVFPEVATSFSIGPQPCFAAMCFTSTIGAKTGSPGAQVRRKDQDFTISKRLYLRASFHPNHSEGVDYVEANLGYLCAECKTNLDKTYVSGSLRNSSRFEDVAKKGSAKIRHVGLGGHYVEIDSTDGSERIRVSTALGHSLLMDETNNNLKIGHKDGHQVFLEEGSVKIYHNDGNQFVLSSDDIKIIHK